MQAVMQRGRPKLTRLEHEQLYMAMRVMLASHAPYLSQASVRHYEKKLAYRARKIRSMPLGAEK